MKNINKHINIALEMHERGCSIVQSVAIAIDTKNMNEKLEYDNLGRMKYSPVFHYNNGTLWSKEDLDYLIRWYKIIGLDEMSFALSRTNGTVAAKVRELRQKGKMPKGRAVYTKRIQNKKL